MKKASGKPSDELRPEYKRSDFGALVRAKYAQRIAEATNVAVLEPGVARAQASRAADGAHDPNPPGVMMSVRHRHSAQWAWW